MFLLLGLGAGAYAADFSDLGGTTAGGLKAKFAADEAKGYVINPAPAVVVVPKPKPPAVPVEWVTIPGGRFDMGTDDPLFNYPPLGSAMMPVHKVSIKTFQMSKTHVTVEQYAECVAAKKCAVPLTEPTRYCNWGKPGRENHPVNCVTWQQAQDYARFAGARLPSESEWEYAATSGGKNIKYPWGNEVPNEELAVMKRGHHGTLPVCARPKGNTEQGLCDMSGNLWQWLQDTATNNYKGAPADGSAFEGPGVLKSLRGGSYQETFYPTAMRSDYRYGGVLNAATLNVGFRLAR